MPSGRSLAGPITATAGRSTSTVTATSARSPHRQQFPPQFIRAIPAQRQTTQHPDGLGNRQQLLLQFIARQLLFAEDHAAEPLSALFICRRVGLQQSPHTFHRAQARRGDGAIQQRRQVLSRQPLIARQQQARAQVGQLQPAHQDIDEISQVKMVPLVVGNRQPNGLI